MAEASEAARLDSRARQNIRKRIKEVSGWMAKEEEMHTRRMDWFREQMDEAYAKCPHVQSARKTQPSLYPGEPTASVCTDCGKALV